MPGNDVTFTAQLMRPRIGQNVSCTKSDLFYIRACLQLKVFGSSTYVYMCMCVVHLHVACAHVS